MFNYKKKLTKKLLIFFFILLFCCNKNYMLPSKTFDNKRGGHTKSENAIKKEHQESKELLSNDDKKKYNLLIFIFDKIINKSFRPQIAKYYSVKGYDMKVALIDDLYIGKINKYTSLLQWISKDLLKQQKLVEAFNPCYKFLEIKHQEYLNKKNLEKKTLEQYIMALIDCDYFLARNKKQCEALKYDENGIDTAAIVQSYFFNILYSSTAEDIIEQVFHDMIRRLISDAKISFK